jgi:GNAT superfamily N-acetyltransferase
MSNNVALEATHPAAGAVLNVADAPPMPGLLFRRFRGASDYPQMAAVIGASADADQSERADTVENIAITYAHLSNSDPYRDMIFAEVDGQMAGYGRGWWQEEPDGPIIYAMVGFVAPDWRRKGIGRAMLRWMEARLGEVAAEHQADRPKFFQAFADMSAAGLVALLESEGYAPVRYGYEMVRPSLDDIPDFPLPDGFEIRPALPEHYRAIWDADIEAFLDHWGHTTRTEEDYQGWLENKSFFQPDLWQIAWHVSTNEVAGQVQTFINKAENEKYHRRRGYTEGISVRRPFRRRGLARALIAESLRVQRERGMTESALGVDSENLSGATRVYEDCGFRTVKRSATFRKALWPAAATG